MLILETGRGLKIHAVGRVTNANQRDFHRANPAPIYVIEHTEAVTLAQTLVSRGGRIFLVKIDKDRWSELPDR